MSKSLDRFTLLETFIRIAETGSISAAARDLHLSQPSVSRQLVDLEKRLNTQLIRRNTHSLALTDSGLELLADARSITNGWQMLEEKYLSAHKDIRGKLKVIAPLALGQVHLARTMCEFQMAHPAVSVTWQLQDEPIRFSEQGCDCWIKVGEVPDDTLVVRQLGTVERLLVAAPELHWHESNGHFSFHEPAQLTDMPLVALQPFEGKRIPLKHKDGNEMKFAGKTAMISNNIFAVKEAALMGLGCAVLPRWFISDELASGRLVDILPDWRAPTLTVNVAYLSGLHQPERLRVFLAHLKQSILNIEGIHNIAN